MECTGPVELSDTELDPVAGGLVVPALIAILIPILVPTDMSSGQIRRVSAGNPMPRPR